MPNFRIKLYIDIASSLHTLLRNLFFVSLINHIDNIKVEVKSTYMTRLCYAIL